MGDVNDLVASAKQRFERLRSLERKAAKRYERVQTLLSLLDDEYEETTTRVQDEIDGVKRRLDRLEEDADRVAEDIPDLALQDSFDEIKEVVDDTPFHDCITRDEYARRYC
mgnify:CR=1 FL=1